MNSNGRKIYLKYTLKRPHEYRVHESSYVDDGVVPAGVQKFLKRLDSKLPRE